MRNVSRLFTLVLLTIIVGGCANSAPIGKGAVPSGTVTHVVLMYLYDRGDIGARTQVMHSVDQLRGISDVRTIWAGRMLTSTRPIVNQDYDIAMVVTFNGEDAMQHYLDDPKHLEVKKRVLDRYVRKYVVYDFVSE